MLPTTTHPPIDPRRLARLAGVLYVVIIVSGLFSELVVRDALVVAGDPSATADNISGAESLFRLGIVGDLVMVLADVGIAVALYLLLAPVSRILSATAAAFRLAQAAVIGLNLVHQIAALLVLDEGGSLGALATDQREAMALLLLDMHSYGYLLGLVFFAGNLVVIGYLIHRSGFLPRAFGVLAILAAAGYLADTLLFVLVAGYDGAASNAVLAPAFVFEIGFALWLLLKGVDAASWRRAAGQATEATAPGVAAEVGAGV
jgi:hypothetical protein